jgi:hypothetical protein
LQLKLCPYGLLLQIVILSGDRASQSSRLCVAVQKQFAVNRYSVFDEQSFRVSAVPRVFIPARSRQQRNPIRAAPLK